MLHRDKNRDRDSYFSSSISVKSKILQQYVILTLTAHLILKFGDKGAISSVNHRQGRTVQAILWDTLKEIR